MKKLVYIICVALALSMFTGCEKKNETKEKETEISTTKEKQSDYDRMNEDISKLKQDSTIPEIKEILGEPDEEFGSGIMHMKWSYGKCKLETIHFSEDNWMVQYRDEDGKWYDNVGTKDFYEFKEVEDSTTNKE